MDSHGDLYLPLVEIWSKRRDFLSSSHLKSARKQWIITNTPCLEVMYPILSNVMWSKTLKMWFTGALVPQTRCWSRGGHRGMQGSIKADRVLPGLGRMSAMTEPLHSDPLEKLNSQADSFLTAARLHRRGWTAEGKKTRWQFSDLDCSVRQPPLSRSDGNQGPECAEICPKDPRSRQVPVVNNREDRKMCSEKQGDEAKQTSEGGFSASGQAERQTTIICVWASRCRTSCRQSKRFKAPILPVIAEI